MGNSKKVLIKSSRNPGGQLYINIGGTFFSGKSLFLLCSSWHIYCFNNFRKYQNFKFDMKKCFSINWWCCFISMKTHKKKKKFFKFNYRVLVKKSVSHYKRRVLLLVTITICHHSKNYNWMYISVIQYLLLPVLMQ